MMPQNSKKDPRVMRTCRLIQDAFLSLAAQKDFESITVKEITDRASVNRATFYAHFEDKYALLDHLVSDAFIKSASGRIKPDADLTEGTLKELILIVCDYQDSINLSCKKIYRSASALIDSQVQRKLHAIIMSLLMNKMSYTDIQTQKLKIISVMISHSIYSATSHWYREEKTEDKTPLLAILLPFLKAGIESTLLINLDA